MQERLKEPPAILVLDTTLAVHSVARFGSVFLQSCSLVAEWIVNVV